MKLFRFALNIWITLVSILSFLFGWVILAHAPKPVQPTTQQSVSVAPLPTLTPLDSSQFGSNNDFPSFQAPSTAFSSQPQPIFRTGGS